MSTPPDNTPRSSEPPRDELDELLREWHGLHAKQAAAARDRLLDSLSGAPDGAIAPDPRPRRDISSVAPDRPSPLVIIRRLIMNRYTPAAASLMLVAALLAALLVPWSNSTVQAAQEEVMIPEGGRLDALDETGTLIGPCPLTHTDVVADISGPFARVTLTQQYHNPYDNKIEAVYTFPLSHHGAVDRMTMTVGDRLVIGEVKERREARRIYEAAKETGYVASLLEQERPNIFTQSVANIEPGAAVTVEISYVEIIEPADGVYAFDFPMTVAPRYIPGSPTVSPALVPAELTMRRGVILSGRAQLTLGEPNNVDDLGTLQVGKLEAMLSSAQSIAYPGAAWWGEGENAKVPEVWYPFEAAYCNGAKELGWLYVDGTGQINGRWFYTDPDVIRNMGTGFGQDTNQVPDASRITPMPALPGTRAGHDISLTVNIDSGGPVIVDYESELHEIDNVTRVNPRRRSSRVSLALANQKELPNRDFVLRWKLADDRIQESHFTHVGDFDDYAGGFFTLMLQPPARVEDADARPRELVFVLDTSGSMSGFPIEKAKAVMAKAIDAMRPRDTFNVITFAGHTSILWTQPRPATPANRKAARDFVELQQGGGGTEMMKAIHAALMQEFPIDVEAALTPAQLADQPADGRGVEVIVEYTFLEQAPAEDDLLAPQRIRVREDLALAMRPEAMIPSVLQPRGAFVRLTGRWATEQGRRVLVVERAKLAEKRDAAPPMRICMFLTDGQVGNDQAIIDAVRSNRATTRVFSFGIGNSPNRFLLEGMADAGRGEVEFVTLESDGDEAVERFTKRIATPVLTDIQLAFSDGLEVTDTIPALDDVPDLFDVKPLIIHGRYAPGEETRSGTLTIRGLTGTGPYERAIDLELPAAAPEHDVIATLWARSRVDELTKSDDRPGIIALGESFQIMTAYTSFVAVEKSRVTIDGKPVLVAVPIEMPEGQSWEGTFGIADPERLVDAEEVGAATNAKGKDVLRRTIATLKNTVNQRGLTEVSQVYEGDRFQFGAEAISTETGQVLAGLRGVPIDQARDQSEALFGYRFENAPQLDIDDALNQDLQVGDKVAAGHSMYFVKRGSDLADGRKVQGKLPELSRIPIPDANKLGVQLNTNPRPGQATAGSTIVGREVTNGASLAGEATRYPWQSGHGSASAGRRRTPAGPAAKPGGGGGGGFGGGGDGSGGVYVHGGRRSGGDDALMGGGGGGLKDSTALTGQESLNARLRLTKAAERVDEQAGMLRDQLRAYEEKSGALNEEHREAQAAQVQNLERRIAYLETRRGEMVKKLGELGGPVHAIPGQTNVTRPAPAEEPDAPFAGGGGSGGGGGGGIFGSPDEGPERLVGAGLY
ncbi:MAG: VIT and vWA domain-containing protein, partial [Planctomycetota bacterium]